MNLPDVLLQVVVSRVVHPAILAHILLYVQMHSVPVPLQTLLRSKGISALFTYIVLGPDLGGVNNLLVPEQTRRGGESRPAFIATV